MAYTKLNPHFTPLARVEEISRDLSHYLLSIPFGKADKYRVAQLDDYAQLNRGRFPHRPPLVCSLSARVSSDSLPGTWGFGLWNDPFGLSIGYGGRPFRIPALPNAVWFFGASKENYLSFASGLDTSETNTRSSRPAVNGFLAQVFRAPKFHPLLIPAGLTLPFLRRTTRRLMSRIVAEDTIQLLNRDAQKQVQTPQSVDPTDWHRYKIEWSPTRVSFEIDDVQMLESSVSPNPPLGLVIWIDNQFAKFTPKGEIGFGVLENPEPVWLEVKDIEVA